MFEHFFCNFLMYLFVTNFELMITIKVCKYASMQVCKYASLPQVFTSHNHKLSAINENDHVETQAPKGHTLAHGIFISEHFFTVSLKFHSY